DYVTSCAFSRDGAAILSASADSTIRLWDRETGKEIRQYKGHTNWVTSCALSRDGAAILSASTDSTIRLWDRETGKEIRQPMHLPWLPLQACFAPDTPGCIISANTNGTLALYNISQNKSLI
ncbi:MAG: hypothetical protein HQK84_05125, partial [Nitrospinae bacterium]|nr:hypothetical protein [Nitrospinota bacterium]